MIQKNTFLFIFFTFIYCAVNCTNLENRDIPIDKKISDSLKTNISSIYDTIIKPHPNPSLDSIKRALFEANPIAVAVQNGLKIKASFTVDSSDSNLYLDMIFTNLLKTKLIIMEPFIHGNQGCVSTAGLRLEIPPTKKRSEGSLVVGSIKWIDLINLPPGKSSKHSYNLGKCKPGNNTQNFYKLVYSVSKKFIIDNHEFKPDDLNFIWSGRMVTSVACFPYNGISMVNLPCKEVEDSVFFKNAVAK